MSTTDGVVLAVLLTFAAWGAVRGPLRQLVSLSLLGLAFLSAAPLGRRAAPLVEKVGGLGADEAIALAWGLSFFLILVVGGLLLAATRRWIAAAGCGGATGRTIGALLGAAKGAVLLLIVGYAVLAWPAAESGGAIALRRETQQPGQAPDASRPWRIEAADSRAAVWLVRGGDALRQAVVLPAWVDQAMERVDADVRAAR